MYEKERKRRQIEKNQKRYFFLHFSIVYCNRSRLN